MERLAHKASLLLKSLKNKHRDTNVHSEATNISIHMSIRYIHTKRSCMRLTYRARAARILLFYNGFRLLLALCQLL